MQIIGFYFDHHLYQTSRLHYCSSAIWLSLNYLFQSVPSSLLVSYYCFLNYSFLCFFLTVFSKFRLVNLYFKGIYLFFIINFILLLPPQTATIESLQIDHHESLEFWTSYHFFKGNWIYWSYLERLLQSHYFSWLFIKIQPLLYLMPCPG